MKTKLLLLAFVVMLSACTASMYELSPVEKTNEYYKGREILTDEDSQAAVFINFEEQRDSYFVFYVEALNKGDSPITIDPAVIYTNILEIQGGQKVESTCVYALDPEAELEAIKKSKANGKVAHAVAQGLFGVIGFAEVASDLDRHDGRKADFDAAKWGAVLSTNEAIHNENMDELEKKEYRWQNEVLRKTTLYKNDRMGGLIYIPFDKNAEVLGLTVPLGEKDYRFLFRQTKLN